jgi:hypothetical protein
LTISRLCLGMSYLNVHFLEALIQQLAQVSIQKNEIILTVLYRFAQVLNGMHVK